MVEKYALLVQKIFVYPKRFLKNKFKSKEVDNILKEYDKKILEEYIKIEKMIDSELNK
jgi:hypothetical protein